jgi:dTDP-glucose pyrophosphorylase
MTSANLDFLKSQTATISDAIATLDHSEGKIVVVVDENSCLLGTVTDGDIRRGLLKGFSLSDPVSKIMNMQPAFMQDDASKIAIETRMRDLGLRQMPLLDDKGRVVSVRTLIGMTSPDILTNWVVIMAGGQGKRLRPLTDDRPKPMLHVGGKPILETILVNFVKAGFRKFFISLNYKAEVIENYFGDGTAWGIEILYLREDEPLGTAGALTLLPSLPDQPVIVMNGDILTSVNFRHLLDFHTSHNSGATVCVRPYDFQVPYGVVEVENQTVLEIIEKPVHQFFVNGGIYVLEPGVLKEIPHDQFFDMPELLDKLIAKQIQTTAFPLREYWLDVGQHEEFERAQSEFESVFSGHALDSD